MDNYNPAPEIEIDLVDLMWKLLMQWKAILIVCIIMALMVSGAKYAKDSNAYKAQLADKAVAEEQASKPVEEQIEAALELLPSKDRQAVLFCVQMQESADLQQNYLDNSILMNEDPANQRTLSVNYLIKSDSGTSMKALVESYNAGLRNDDFMNSLRDVIAPDADLEYIYELVNNDYGVIVSDYTDSSSTAYAVKIVLPEEADADAVTALVGPEMERLHQSLDTAVGSHGLQRISTEDAHVYNRYAAERKTSVLNNINTLNNNIKTAKSSLSPEQLTAAESIIAIKQASDKAEDLMESDDDIQKPGFSKKYALLGFILGAFLYAGIYVVMLILKKVVGSANTAQSCTGTRLLGEVYKLTEHKGLSALFASAAVAKWRYKEKLDADSQIESLAATVDAVCTHHGTDKLTLLLSGLESGFDDTVKAITEKCRKAGDKKSIDILDADAMEEKILDSVDNAVYVLSSMSKVDKLGSLMALCSDYDVKPLGTIYMEEL